MALENETNKESHIRSLLERYYRGGPLTSTSGGYLIRCPWHADNNPSCTVFFSNGVFFCWRCHFGKEKRGESPLEGFRKLGVPDEELQVFKRKSKAPDNFTPVKTLDEVLSEEYQRQGLLVPSSEDEDVINPRTVVLHEETWPQWWGYRGISHDTFRNPLIEERFRPRLVKLELQGKKGPYRERLPRLSCSLPLTRALRQHELETPGSVYLRLSSEQLRKSINQHGLDLTSPLLLPLGLPRWKLSRECRGVILVEGTYDALRTWQNLLGLGLGGIYEVGALLGTGQWGHAWKEKVVINLLPQFQVRRDLRLILAFDQDEAGEELIPQVIEDVEPYLKADQLRVLSWPLTTKDPGDLGFTLFCESWEQLNL